MDEESQLVDPETASFASIESSSSLEPSSTESSSVEAIICQVIAKELGVPIEMVEQAGTLRETPGMESLRLLRAVTGVEKKFGIELPDELVFSIESVPHLAEVVREQLAKGNHV